jgi:hypothetical protein
MSGLNFCFCALASFALGSGPDRSRAEEPKPARPDKTRAVLIDFSQWSVNSKVDVTFALEFDGIQLKPETYSGDEGFEPDDFAHAYERFLKSCGARVERFNKTQLLIHGIEKDCKFYPVVKGTVTSKTLPLGVLPKVTNPPEADSSVQIDFAPLANAMANEYQLRVVLTTDDGKGLEQNYKVGKNNAPADIAELVRESLPDGFDAKLDGAKLVVNSFKGKSITKVTAAGIDLPIESQPKVGRPKK